MRPSSMELQVVVDDAGGGVGDLAYRWLDEVSLVLAPEARARVASLPARIARGPLGEPGDVFGHLSVSRRVPGRRTRPAERHASDAGMRWLRQELREVPRSVHLWFGNLDDRGNRAGGLCSAHVDRHDDAPNRVVLSCYLSEAELTDPADGARVQRTYLDFLLRFVDQVDPAFGHIAYHDQGRTAFEAGLRNIDTPAPPDWWSYPRTLTACRETLRGYSWLTILPRELLDRVGGTDTLVGSGAFIEVRPLSAGGVWLLATDDYRTFDDAALLRVFHALAPALRPGPVTLWPPPPGQPALRVIPKDASRHPLGHQDATSPQHDPSTPFWWTATMDNPDTVCVERVPDADLTGAVEPIGTAYWRVPLVAQVALPPDGDPAQAAEILADSVVGHFVPMRADVGYAPSTPASAPEAWLADSPLERHPTQQTAVYFVHLVVESPTRPEPARVFAELDIVWSYAWKRRNGLTGQHRPVFIPTTMDDFKRGYATTTIRRTSLQYGDHRQ